MREFKSKEQIEFADLCESLKVAGTNGSAVAAYLDVTPQAISMILSGKREPGPLMLRELRRLAEPQVGMLHDAPAADYKKILAKLRRQVENLEIQIGGIKQTLEELEQ